MLVRANVTLDVVMLLVTKIHEIQAQVLVVFGPRVFKHSSCTVDLQPWLWGVSVELSHRSKVKGARHVKV